MRILVVDDSVVFRTAIKGALDGAPGIEVAGIANNGKIAIDKLKQGSYDLVTLDMEMPEMNGLETIKAIKASSIKVRIIIFSSHTPAGSEAALEALRAGADDFVSKPKSDSTSTENVLDVIRKELLPKVQQFNSVEKTKMPPMQQHYIQKSPIIDQKTGKKEIFIPRDIDTFNPNVVLIGSSTGGPPALEAVLAGLKSPLKIPIFITQHMPPIFTESLAKRIKNLVGVECAEAKNGEIVVNNKIYIAPGDFHLTLEKIDGKVVIKLDQSAQRNSVRPAVDVMFESAIKIYGSRTLGVILTGMGEDGLVGCLEIKRNAGGVIIQNKESCVVFGMPGAVYNQGLQDKVANLTEINTIIKRVTT